MWRQGELADEDAVLDAGLQVPTPVMERMWAVRKQAMATSCMKEFVALLGIKTKDMQGCMRVFTKATKTSGIPMAKLAATMRLPSGATGQASPVLVHLFNALGSIGADGASQGLTFRTFMFLHVRHHLAHTHTNKQTRTSVRVYTVRLPSKQQTCVWVGGCVWLRVCAANERGEALYKPVQTRTRLLLPL